MFNFDRHTTTGFGQPKESSGPEKNQCAMHNLEIIYIQPDLVWENPAANRERFEKMVLSHPQKADLIVLPETFTTGFPVDPAPFAETEEGETFLWMRRMAAQTGAVITGSFLMKTGRSFTNTLVWMRPDGTFEKYHKRHVFSMGGEHERIQPGEKQLVVTLKGWKIRPMVCYDLRFPVWCKNRYDGRAFEYDLALFVANWPAVRAFPWNSLLTARAIENQAFVLGVNRVGRDGPGNRYSGHSKVVDAKGNVLSEAPENREAVMQVSLSGDDLMRFRRKFNVGRDWDRFKILPAAER